MNEARKSTGAGLPATLLGGFALGVLCFGALLFAELAWLGRDERAVLGAPISTIVATYLLAGAAVGVVTGAGVWLIARRWRLRPVRLAAVALVLAAVVLFVLRSTTGAQLTSPSLKMLALLVAAIVSSVAGIRWARAGAGKESSRKRVVRYAGIGAAAAACVISGAWTPIAHYRVSAHAGATADTPNIVFVLIDALRADRLSSFGYGRPTSPFMDRLASEGTAFLNAYAHGNRTIISMPSLFTAMYPSYARAIDNTWSVPLPDSQTTIAELCRGAGYSTIGIMSNPFLTQPFGLTQGFDRVEEFHSGRFGLSLYRVLLAAGAMEWPRYARGLTASATEVTDAAVGWMDRLPAQAPFFCYVHYMDVHHPYLPPSEYERMFRSRDQLASIDPADLFARTVALVKEQRRYPLDEPDLTRLSDLYDGCIRYVDSQIARLTETALQVNDRPTIVIITSDHGDEFQEHGHLYHNNVVIQELIRVPLVIWRSDGPAGEHRVDDLVRHVDLLPTIVEWLGVDAPAASVGRSLSPLLVAGHATAGRASIAEGDYCSAVVEPGWKLMHVDTTGFDTLFDLDADPWAAQNIALVNSERAEQMRAVLDTYLRSAPRDGGASRTVTNEAILRQLQALGYMN